MSFLKHFFSLIKELFQFALKHKAWWVIPMVVIFFGIGLLVVVGESSAPFIYTLF